jgi:hypothetical protein
MQREVGRKPTPPRGQAGILKCKCGERWQSPWIKKGEGKRVGGERIRREEENPIAYTDTKNKKG